MKINLSLCVVIFATGMMTACSLQKTTAAELQNQSMTVCEKVERLVDAYNSGFDSLKGPLQSARFLDIWAANIDAVGKDCQIWRSGSHSTYTCIRNAPNETVALDWYEGAAREVGQCLTSWQQKQTHNEEENRYETLWTKDGNHPSVAIVAFPSRGKRWVVYYFVGDRDQWF